MEDREAPVPLLPLHQQKLQEAEEVMPPRREVQGHGGLRALGLGCLRGGTSE